MGKILSVMRKPIRDFNLESRAHQVISREKPIPAPKYKADIEELERIKKEHPDLIKESMKKNKDLNERLKVVFVKSYNPPESLPPTPLSQNPNKPLPMNRTYPGDFEYGFQEPDNVPLGKTTLKKALQFINDHQFDREAHSSMKIAQNYNLPHETVENILKYCKIFEMYIPEKGQPKTTYFGPRVPRTKIVAKEQKLLPPNKNSEEKT